MTSTFTTIPVIDISGLSGTSEQKQTVVENLGDAARHVGFMYITGHGMEPSLFSNMLRETKAFFDLPIEEKMALYIGKSSNHRGYVPQGEEVFPSGSKDLKEAFDLSLDLPSDDPDYLAGNPLLGPNQWPPIPQFREIITAYYNSVFNVGRRLISAFALALGLDADAFEKSLTRPPSQLRLIHYPYDPTAHDVAGIGAHTDFECFTLLRATAPGLEVMNGQGEWIDAPPVENAFIVNIGDMLELLSGGEFIATSHRVRKVKEERYSFPLFFSLDYDVRVQPLPGRENPALPAQSLVAGEHLFAQTAQIFTYLKQRLADGSLVLPDSSLALSSFGQEARHPNA
ncbi:isopenicillin N synthase family dioxygenase [Acetobacter sicerae]|uniref:isopenicillin N synthase family dioxygenase n=1 Tax=Acetobacter sicerae TaxID=85325 RepID=UPI00156AC791|nr:isopenicillin N synthase family oxygenase [Acetobacter sicerae]NHN91963.1 isopenicillin N synthase family oxygenase [Acetobacter sicerae]